MKKLENFLVEKIKQSGFPLEINIGSIIKSVKPWRIYPNSYFLDKDENKGRELDIKADIISADLSHLESRMRHLVDLTLLISCKQLPGHAWIFFKDISDPYIHICRESLNDIIEHHLGDPYFEVLEKKDTHFEKKDALSTNYLEIIFDDKKSNKKENNIFESIITLIKATSFEKEEQCNETKDFIYETGVEELLKNPFSVFNVYYPLIIFDGELYEAIIEKKILLRKVNYVLFHVEYKSGNYKGDFHIDIVKKDFFPTYFEYINNDFRIFIKRTKQRLNKLDDGLKKIMKLYVDEKKVK
jgi:hypothetical protein